MHPDSFQPSLEPLWSAAEKAGVGEDAITWVTSQLTMFLDLSRQRTRFQGGCNSLNLGDIQTYLILNNLELHHIEMENILHLDHLFMNIVREQVEEQLKRAQKQGA